MSNYLTRLAARLTAPTPQIVPRPVSRFEGAVQSPLAEDEDESVQQLPTWRAGQVSGRPSLAPPNAPVVNAPPRQIPRQPVLSAITPLVPLAPAVPVPGPRPSPTQPPTPLSLASSNDDSSAVPPEPSISTRTVVLTPAPTPASTITRIVTQPPAAPTTPPDYHTTSPSAPKHVRDDRPKPASSSLEPEAETEQPVIEISVGRIEVHAPPAERKHTKQPVRPQPQLTLEAYLRERRGGMR